MGLKEILTSGMQSPQPSNIMLGNSEDLKFSLDHRNEIHGCLLKSIVINHVSTFYPNIFGTGLPSWSVMAKTLHSPIHDLGLILVKRNWICFLT